MVYRLVPSSHFNAKSKFGVDDMKATPVIIGSVVGLLFGILFCVLFERHAVHSDEDSNLYKWFVKLDKNGKPTVLKNWQFWLVAINICVACTALGIGIGHHSKDE